MEKIMLYGIGNEKKFNHYTFEKTKKAHKILADMLSEIFKINWMMQEESHDENDNILIKKVDISKYKDFHQIMSSTRDKEHRIDIFFGNKKMFMTIHCPLGKRRKFHDKLKAIVEMPGPKKLIKAKVRKISNGKKKR